MSEVTSEAFRAVLSQWASGVCVVTTRSEGLLYGLTVSSFSSVSLDPPLVLVCIANQNRMVEMVGSSRKFAVSVLGSDQEEASAHFARPGRLPVPELTEIPTEQTSSGLPVVAGALAWMTCDLHELIPMGDHTLAVGRATGTGGRADRSPLLYWSRGYRKLSE